MYIIYQFILYVHSGDRPPKRLPSVLTKEHLPVLRTKQHLLGLRTKEHLPCARTEAETNRNTREVLFGATTGKVFSGANTFCGTAVACDDKRTVWHIYDLGMIISNIHI